ncbi:hypothetical protein Trydic_g9463 [Trypoxylus dichotomus]
MRRSQSLSHLQEGRLVLREAVGFTIAAFIIFLVFLQLEASNTKQTSRKSLKTHDVLTKIGFSRIRAPNSHHKKRLAVESRQHSRSDDSHMYIIKLPPNQHYYVHNRPNALAEEPSKNLPVGFKNNGRPAKIYHWNIPVLKKINNTKIFHKTRLNNKVANFKNADNWNDVLDKPPKGKKSKKGDKILNYKKQSFYVPAKPKKSSFFKYFPGNGKPKSFYVIDSSKKKAHYHRLLP